MSPRAGLTGNAAILAAVGALWMAHPAASLAAEFAPIAYVNPEVESAHISMGRLKVAYPVFNLDFGAGVDVGDFGYLLAGAWTESDLTNHYRDRRRQTMQEIDPVVAYGYRLEIEEGWSLDSRLGAQWNIMSGSYGAARRTYDEWQFRETLATPYFTAWYGMRNFYLPVAKASFCAGVTRSFPIAGRLSLAPAFWLDGGSDLWNEQRFGYTDRRGRIAGGVNSCSLRLLLNYGVFDGVDVYCGLTGYLALGGDVRGELDANPSREAKSELVVATAGIRWSM